ncbi:MAG TPA: 8-oxoguanine deaminase, partial [Sulfitobacter sp.]|nr:8-oxoguanine deaminase [Sulfitobacter sp.]
MTELLIRNADYLLTMDETRRELVSADVLLRDGVVVAVGQNLTTEGEVIEASGCVVTPGLVNTHHHLYQSLTRAVPGGQDALLFGWLKTLYPIWARFTPDHMYVSAQVGLAELALSGCTLSSDHLYMYPNGSRLEDTIHASAEIGMRFQPTRGAMSIGESDGGLPPDALVEREAAILEDCIRVIDGFHDPSASS